MENTRTTIKNYRDTSGYSAQGAKLYVTLPVVFTAWFLIKHRNFTFFYV